MRLSYQWSNYLGRIGQTIFWQAFSTFFFFLGYQNDNNWKTLETESQRRITNKAEITEQALIKLIKITESYENFVSFIGCELNEKVLE